MKYSIDLIFPTRNLTADEYVFLSGLSAYTLVLKGLSVKKSLPLSFCINYLQSHTELVLSGEVPTRWEFPDRKGLEEEIKELEELIDWVWKKIERGELKQEELALPDMLKGQLDRLKEALKDMDDAPSSKPKLVATNLLGLYQHNGGHDSRVTLYVNNIELAAGRDPQKTMYLMGQVLLHEYFHSFYYHTGSGSNPVLKYAEEPMAEFGSLVALKEVALSKVAIAPWAKTALPYVVDFVKGKQKAIGITAAYGFGAYLYEYHRPSARYMITRYAKVSRLLNGRDLRALKYKYMVYPKYPKNPGLEYAACMMLKNLLRSSGMSRTTPAKTFPMPPIPTPTPSSPTGKIVVMEKKIKVFAFEVFKYLERKGLLKQIDPYVTTTRKAHLIALVESGVFNMAAAFLDYSLAIHTPGFIYDPGLWFPHDFVIDGKKCHLSQYWIDSGKDPDPHLQLYKLVRMLDYVYPGRFKYRKDADMYILED